jgi:hypothetical protein
MAPTSLFLRPHGATRGDSALAARSGRKIDGLQEGAESAAAYRHRMRVNFFAAGLLILLMGAGMWIADAMVDTQKAHGCYASGQRCSLI